MSEPVNPYKQAAESAIARVNEQWARWEFNVWSDYTNRIFNENFFPVWYPWNVEATESSVTDEQQLINLFYIWCWLKLHNYQYYSAIGVLASSMQESRSTGVCWEFGYRPYETLQTFDAWSMVNPTARQTWYNSRGIVTWTATANNEWADYQDPTQAPHIVSKTAVAGSWDAVEQYPIATTTRDGLVYVPEPAEFDRSNPWVDAIGYGIWQWTWFTRLINHAGRATSAEWIADRTSKGSINGDGRYFWPANPTLQMMALDYEESQNDVTPREEQYGDYQGEWLNSLRGWMISATATSEGHTHINYDRDMSWAEFKSDSWVDHAIALMEAADSPQMDFHSEGTINDGLCFLALTTFGRAYSQHSYGWDSHMYTVFKARFAKLQAAIECWEANNYYDPAYIPRAYDVSYCELDKYHLHPALITTITGRRRKHKNERTILL